MGKSMSDRDERKQINALLKPHGLHLCVICGDPCVIGEEIGINSRDLLPDTRCWRCRGIIQRVRRATEATVGLRAVRASQLSYQKKRKRALQPQEGNV